MEQGKDIVMARQPTIEREDDMIASEKRWTDATTLEYATFRCENKDRLADVEQVTFPTS
jgi:hypothetical protein